MIVSNRTENSKFHSFIIQVSKEYMEIEKKIWLFTVRLATWAHP